MVAKLDFAETQNRELGADSNPVAKLNDEIKKLEAQLQEEIDARTSSKAAKRFQIENQSLSDELAKLEHDLAKTKQELEELRKDKNALDKKIRIIFSIFTK
jgi:predicted  nucleic acid-binding Zn-ribbon protein